MLESQPGCCGNINVRRGSSPSSALFNTSSCKHTHKRILYITASHPTTSWECLRRDTHTQASLLLHCYNSDMLSPQTQQNGLSHWLLIKGSRQKWSMCVCECLCFCRFFLGKTVAQCVSGSWGKGGGLLVPLITSVLTLVFSLSHSAKWVCQVSNYELLNWKFSCSLYSVSIFSRRVEATAVTGGNAGGIKVSSPWWTHSQSPFCHRSRSNYSAGPERREGQTET